MTDRDAFWATLARDVASAMIRGATEVRSVIEERLSVPVDYSTSPETRSKPGEPPRRDTGRLQGSFVVESLGDLGDQVQVALYTDVPYADPLQMEMDRPITTGIGESNVDLVVEQICDEIETPSH